MIVSDNRQADLTQNVIFNEINKTLSTPIDMKSFERGEIAIINVTNQDMIDVYENVPKFENDTIN